MSAKVELKNGVTIRIAAGVASSSDKVREKVAQSLIKPREGLFYTPDQDYDSAVVIAEKMGGTATSNQITSNDPDVVY